MPLYFFYIPWCKLKRSKITKNSNQGPGLHKCSGSSDCKHAWWWSSLTLSPPPPVAFFSPYTVTHALDRAPAYTHTHTHKSSNQTIEQTSLIFWYNTNTFRTELKPRNASIDDQHNKSEGTSWVKVGMFKIFFKNFHFHSNACCIFYDWSGHCTRRAGKCKRSQ